MAVLDIIRMGHPTLRQDAKPYPPARIGSAEFKEMIDDMRQTMVHAGGIGLAAPQVNIPYQVAVIEIPDTGTRYGEVPALAFAVYINPRITVIDKTEAGYWEGCLSVPGLMGFVERPQHIQVDYLDDRGQSRSLEAKGFTATVFQHEFDHLFGTLYVDRIRDRSQLVFEEEYHRFHESPEPE